MLRNIKIGRRLWGSFATLLLITIAIGILAVQSLNKLSDLTSDMYSHPLTVSNAVRDVKINIGKIRTLMVTVGLDEKDPKLEQATLERTINEINNIEREIFGTISVIKERFLGSQAQVDITLELIHNWKTIRDEEIRLAQIDKHDELIAIIKGRGAKHVAQINKQIEGLLIFANNKAAEFLEDSHVQRDKTITFLLTLLAFLVLSGCLVAFYTTRGITRPLNRIRRTTEAVAGGELDTDVGQVSNDEIGQLAKAIKDMQSSLRESHRLQLMSNWHKDGLARLNNLIAGNPSTEKLANDIITDLCRRLSASLGTLYILHDEHNPPILRLAGGYGYSSDAAIQTEFVVGEGLIGQAAKEQQPILVNNPPEDYIKVESSLGGHTPTQLVVFPCFHEDKLMAVIEIGVFDPLNEQELSFIEEVLLIIGVAIEAAENREQLNIALVTANRLTEEAQAQQEEMESLNEELEEQNQLLHEEKTKVEQTQLELKTKAEDLALASRYKSEFLANMSHELRTPLNSLLLLSRGLADNKDDSLSEEQVESAKIIYQSGHDLLDLINEILDLSKIEAGRMELNVETMRIQDLAGSIQANFGHMADEKDLFLEIELDTKAPGSIRTDRRRLEQVIKNLISNALKFTDNGGITVTFSIPPESESYALALSVTDTGLGIAESDQAHIFEAFQQADGSTSRKFGGTGLGLSISRELAGLLGGEIQLKSEPNKGSTFTILLPLQAPAIQKVDELYPHLRVQPKTKNNSETQSSIEDDREIIQPGDRVILIVEDNLSFLGILMQNSREHDFKCLAATSGENALELASQYRPNAILLDLMLPGISGWQVLEQLKQNTDTRHIPVHIVSIQDPDSKAMRQGAIGYLQKPVSQEGLESVLSRLERVVSTKTRNLLVVEDDKAGRLAIRQLIGNGVVNIDEAETGTEALNAIKTKQYDCIILDLGLPDMDGRELLTKMAGDHTMPNPPVIIYTGRELSREDEIQLRDYSDSIIIKDVRSEERLLDEVSLFLHRVMADLPQNKRQKIEKLYNTDELLKGRKVLVVDDDMRTLFAVTRLLSENGMDVVKAEGGERALELLADSPDIDIILMDIMMPGLDGYETMERIRSKDKYKSTPIIALTAKAMPEDQQQCLDAGANDYMAKPVDPVSLTSLLRVWLYR